MISKLKNLWKRIAKKAGLLAPTVLRIAEIVYWVLVAIIGVFVVYCIIMGLIINDFDVGTYLKHILTRALEIMGSF